MIDKSVHRYVEYLTQEDIDLIYLAIIYLSENIFEAEEALDVEIQKSRVELLLAKLELDHEFVAEKL